MTDQPPDRYCAAPFRHVHFNVAGNVTPCCDWTGDDPDEIIRQTLAAQTAQAQSQ